jgi:phage shock protein PspC (stress-responsive transcriptional regulator)
MENKHSFFDQIRSTSLRRSQDRWIGGVSGGVAAKLTLPVWLVRLLLVIFTIILGIGLLIYAFLWLFLPDQETDLIPAEEVTHGNVTGEFIGGVIMAAVALLSGGFLTHSLLGFLVIVLLAAVLVVVILNRSNIVVVKQYSGSDGDAEGNPADSSSGKFQGVRLQAGRFEMKAGNFDGENQASISNGSKTYIAKESGEAFREDLTTGDVHQYGKKKSGFNHQGSAFQDQDDVVDKYANLTADADFKTEKLDTESLDDAINQHVNQRINEKMNNLHDVHQRKFREKYEYRFERRMASKPSNVAGLAMWGLGFVLFAATLIIARFTSHSGNLWTDVVFLPFALFLVVLGIVSIVIGAKGKRFGAALGILAWSALAAGFLFGGHYASNFRDNYSNHHACISVNSSAINDRCKSVLRIEMLKDGSIVDLNWNRN